MQLRPSALSRRTFLRSLGQAGAGLLLSACTLPAPLPAPPPSADDFPSIPQTLRPNLNQRYPSLAEKIGQMLLIGFNGTAVNQNSRVVGDILGYGVGGVVLFRQNVGWPQQVTELTAALQTASFQATGLPLFIAADQEGGRVSRITSQFGLQQNYSAQSLGALDDLERTSAYARNVAQSLKQVGINLNLAPVVDLNTNPANPVIGALARSFSADPAVVTRHAGAFVQAHADEGLLCTLKHFPGHGSSRHDSHYGFVDVTTTWRDAELDPYRTLIDAGHGDAVMTAHIFNANLDPELPATLSPAVITDLLRGDLGYDGVIFTDDLQMDAIRAYYRFEDAVRLSVLAGVDVLSISNSFFAQRDAVAIAVDVIRSMVARGEISEDRIEASYQRIVRAKKRLADLLFGDA